MIKTLVDLLKRALLFAQLSKLAYPGVYITREYLASELRDMGFQLFKTLGDPEGLSGYICQNDDYAVVVFCGTHNKVTALADIKCFRTKDEHMIFVSGFYEAYEKLLPEFIDFVKDSTIPVYITGHSLGGGIAEIAKIKLGSLLSDCITFGAPRICTTYKNADITKSVYRFVHEADIVPAVPLLIFGWRHIGHMMYLTDDNIYTGWQAHIRRFIAQVIPIIFKSVFGLLGEVNEHFINDYVGHLASVIAIHVED